MNGMWFAILLYLGLMVALGVIAYYRTKNMNDYMLGGRTIGPVVTALSAGASDMSGWLLMGLPGAMYATGLSSGWIVVGLLLGAYANWLLVAPRLRAYTAHAGDAITIPDYFEKRFHDKSGVLRTVSAGVILIFFIMYASSGFVAGGRLFEAVFGLEYTTGLWILAGVVIAYVFLGGFLAVSWTDVVQGMIMVIALLIVPAVALTLSGGINDTLETIRSTDGSKLELFKGTTTIGIISLLAWGLGYFGQPHIIVRFMAIRNLHEMKSARRVGMIWMTFSIVGAMVTGLIGYAYFTQQSAGLKNPENVFIQLSRDLFPGFITGLLLAALLAAIMSTISTQLLVSSSAATNDFYHRFFKRDASDRELMIMGRVMVLVVAVLAILLSFGAQKSILTLVGYAWAGFGSAFGPVVLFSLLWRRMNKTGALASMITGSVVVIAWILINQNVSGLPSYISEMYEMIPAFIASTIALVIGSLVTKEPSQAIYDEFDQVQAQLKGAEPERKIV
ncbi:sodium/proline symporter PutP [Exiguobacterium acetylicum]|uniref:sodium/proline symporter PutP n=1 Tax=Exiguobacterium acetylicum TaxID=41170 RepID=UPI00387656DD